MTVAAPPLKRSCGVCGLAVAAHSGEVCPYCRAPVEHHDAADRTECRSGRVRMAEARRHAGAHLDDVDREVLGIAGPAPRLPALDAQSIPRMHDAPTTQTMRTAALPRAGTMRRQVLAAVAAHPDGATDDDLEQDLDRSHQSVSACRNGLVSDGWLRPRRLPDGSPVERLTRYGNPAQVWELTPAATLENP